MVTVRTDLGTLRERAGLIRVEETGAITSNNVQDALQAIAAVISGAAWPQRSIETSSDLPVTGADVVLNVNLSGTLAISIPLASGRSGLPLIFQDPAGTWAAHNVTWNRTGSDTFQGATSLVGSINYGWILFRPMNDGINSGWTVQGIYQ